MLAQPQKPGQGLERFPQSHVVGQEAAKTVRRQIGEEMKTLKLIRTHLGGDAGGELGCDSSLDLADPPLDLIHLLLGEEFFCRLIGQLQGVEALGFGRKLARIKPKAGQTFVIVLAQIILQPPPAFALESNVVSFGIEQEFDFFARERRVRDIEHDTQIKPVNRALGDIQFYAP